MGKYYSMWVELGALTQVLKMAIRDPFLIYF
jgi:hypothetical protein